MTEALKTKDVLEKNKNIYAALIEHATNAKKNAYAPYSNFKVGAAIFSELENIYIGTNVENVAYPQGLCAEAGAISNMIAHGEQKIKNIAIVSDGETPICPCGGCLQKIIEFSTDETKIHIIFKDQIFKTYTPKDLMPVQFHNTKFLKN